MSGKKYDLYCEFDLEKHKQTYINYLEVIILPTGKVVYAVPSHQEKLIHIAMQKMNCSRGELMEKCPQEYCFDFLTWLTQITGCVAVWNHTYEGVPNRFQKHKLDELKRDGVGKWQN